MPPISGSHSLPVSEWGCGDRLRLGRAPLAQEDRQHHERRHGEELALPVLQRLEPEARGAARTAERRDRRPAVRALLLVVLRAPADGVQREATARTAAESARRERVLVELSASPPRRTGQGASGRSRAARGSSSTASWPVELLRLGRALLAAGTPSARRKPPICRNSLSQFSKTASTKWPVRRYST